MIKSIKRYIVPPVGRYLINAISSTLKMNVVGYENYNFIKEMGKKCVIVFWHGQQFYPIYYFRGKKIAIMVSMSNDGEIQNSILSSFGYEVVRGSSSRGAVAGLIGLVKKIRGGSDAAIALDGPRGPYHTAKEGVNYLAIKEGCLILPIACAFKSFKQFKAWDQYVMPYPYSEGIMLIGRPIMPDKLNIAAMTHRHLEKILNDMSHEAQNMLLKPAESEIDIRMHPDVPSSENSAAGAAAGTAAVITEAVAEYETETESGAVDKIDADADAENEIDVKDDTVFENETKSVNAGVLKAEKQSIDEKNYGGAVKNAGYKYGLDSGLYTNTNAGGADELNVNDDDDKTEIYNKFDKYIKLNNNNEDEGYDAGINGNNTVNSGSDNENLNADIESGGEPDEEASEDNGVNMDDGSKAGTDGDVDHPAGKGERPGTIRPKKKVMPELID